MSCSLAAFLKWEAEPQNKAELEATCLLLLLLDNAESSSSQFNRGRYKVVIALPSS